MAHSHGYCARAARSGSNFDSGAPHGSWVHFRVDVPGTGLLGLAAVLLSVFRAAAPLLAYHHTQLPTDAHTHTRADTS